MIFHFPGILSVAGGDAMVMFLLVFLHIAAASVADVVNHPASMCYKLQGYLPTADSYMLIYDDCPIWM